MPPKSIFRQPGTQHFQLVHRSQRDPLINDPDASAHVLKPIDRANKGKSRADSELLLPGDTRSNVGEATLYGVYYDDSDYDYMQHLRSVGVQEEGVESILIEAPAQSKRKTKSMRQSALDGLNLPDGVLASTSELPRNFESSQAIPDSIAGFQPDMDAHLRQVLEALDDDAFVDDNVEDDFFSELIADGERGTDEDVAYEFSEDGEEDDTTTSSISQEESWERRFSAFKKTQKGDGSNSDDEFSDGGDTIGRLETISVIGGKRRRRKGESDASGYSMSSSSMYRNEALQTLDERFDQVILKQYNAGDREELDTAEDEEDSDEAPELITSRDDFDSMVNEFLNDFEVLGRKMKPKLEGETGVEKLEVLRKTMGQDERVRHTEADDDDNDDELFPSDDDEDKKDRWDCETILTRHTNIENHPRIIRVRDTKRTPTILLDRKTGLPSIVKPAVREKRSENRVAFAESEGTEESDSVETLQIRKTVARPRNEPKEDKKERKANVKKERQARRAEKKSTKEQYGAEFKDQLRLRSGNPEIRMKKL